MLNRIANIGLVLTALLALMPLGMRAYGHWNQERALDRFSGASAAVPARVTTSRPGAMRPWESCVVIVPSIGAQGVVQPGEGDWKWITGPAYHTNTPGPGGPGNPVIAAHRNMWNAPFEDLDRVKPGELIDIVTATTRYSYVVDWSRTVGAGEKKWLENTKEPCITLYTCTEPYSESRRHVVRGRLISTQPAR